MAGDEVEEGEEGEERLLSVLSTVSAIPSTIIASIWNHQREAAQALSQQHRWKAATMMQMQMSKCIRTRSTERIDRTIIEFTTIQSHLEPCVNH